MSLINDALKRAGEKQSPPPPTPPPMMPVTSTPQKSLLVPALGILLVLAIAGATWLFSRSGQAPTAVADRAERTAQAASASVVTAPKVPEENSQPVSTPVTTQNSKTAEPKVEPVASTPPAPPQVVQTSPAATVAQAPVVTEPAPVPAAPVGPQFPELKLQGITFHPSNPFALINGKTVSVGQKVSGARVTRIERESVTLEWNGETRQLELAN